MEKNGATIKVDTDESWAKAKNYIPDKFTILVYQSEDVPPKIKIGDGVHTVTSLPFLIPEKYVEDNTLVII